MADPDDQRPDERTLAETLHDASHIHTFSRTLTYNAARSKPPRVCCGYLSCHSICALFSHSPPDSKITLAPFKRCAPAPEERRKKHETREQGQDGAAESVDDDGLFRETTVGTRRSTAPTNEAIETCRVARRVHRTSPHMLRRAARSTRRHVHYPTTADAAPGCAVTVRPLPLGRNHTE